MRLLECKAGEVRLTEFMQGNLPDYAILSHTWGPDHEEVTFNDMQTGVAKGKLGYAKIEFCRKQAEFDNLQYFWIDTCCIKKDDAVELQESLNAMFRWYKLSNRCYVYLSDVSKGTDKTDLTPATASWESAFRSSRWFTRGWTLQELLAPLSVTFFSKEGLCLGDRNMLQSLIHDITGIPAEALQGAPVLSQFSVEDRLAWMENRETKRPEDKAHALQGIFDVFMLVMYGCGKELAMRELRKLIDEARAAKLSITDADYHLQNDHYSDERLRIERLSGKRLPMEQCYINLAIVETRKKKTAEGREEKAKEEERTKSSPFELAHRLKIREPEIDIKVELGSMFDSRHSSRNNTKEIRRVLIRGRAGVGKTTLCKRIVSGFKLCEFWKNIFDRVLWIPLRYLKTWTSSQYTFRDFFHHYYFRHHPLGYILADRLDVAIGSNEGQGQKRNTLFILDGLDEVCGVWNSCDPKYEFLVKLLNQPDVIITSRPHAQIPQHVEQPIDLELETIGFYSDQVNDYLKIAFNDSDKVVKAQAILKKFPLIRGLVRIPILLDAFCYTWDTLGISGSDMAPQTMTMFYQAIVQELLRKDIMRLGISSDGQPATETVVANLRPCHLEEAAKKQLILLENLAFTGMFQNMIEFEPGIRDDVVSRIYEQSEDTLLLDHSLTITSFLRTSDPRQTGRNVSYHFLHLTFQEFFAAKYFVRQWTLMGQMIILDPSTNNTQFIQPRDFVAKYKYEPRYDIFWRFVSGLLDGHSLEAVNDFFKTLEDPQSKDLLGPAHQRIITHCLAEVLTEISLRPHLEEVLEKWLILEIRCTKKSVLAAEIEFPIRIFCKVLGNDDYDQGLVAAALKALEKRENLSSTILPLIVARLDDDDSWVREAATKALASQASQSQVQQGLLARLDDDKTWVREAAAEALASQASHSQVQQALLARLDDDDRDVREAAAKALASQASDSQVQQGLLARLDDDKTWVREAAAEALASQASHSQVQQALLTRLNDDDSWVRSAAAKALASQASHSQVQQALLARLNDNDRWVRSAAAKALASQASHSQVQQALLARLDDDETWVREAAAEALASQASHSQVQQALLTRLNDDDSWVRRAAAKALASQASHSQVQQALLARLDDDKTWVREAAAEALASQASHSQVQQALLTRLDDDDGNVRWAAAEALASQASDSQVQQALVARLNDDDSWVREAATHGLICCQVDGLALLHKRGIQNFYSSLFQQSFHRFFSWQILSNTSRLITPERIIEFSLNNGPRYIKELRKAQKACWTPDTKTKGKKELLKKMPPLIQKVVSYIH